MELLALERLVDDPEIRRAAAKTLKGFCLTYLPHHFPADLSDFFDEMASALQDYDAKRLEIIGFRGSVKSTMASLALVLWAALEHPDQYPFIIMLADTRGQALTAGEVDFASMSESAAASASSMGSTFGYFHNLIIGLFAERAGSAVTGWVQDIVGAAAGVPNQVAQLTAEIQQQQASIQQNQAALLQWNGTTAEVNAAHEKARANIEAETVKIAELTRELQPLQAAQQAAGNSAQQYNDAILQLQTDWQTLLAIIGGPFIAAVATQIQYVDQIVQKMQVWAAAHPQLDKEIVTFLAILGPSLTVIGAAAITWAMFSLVITAAQLNGLKTILSVDSPIYFFKDAPFYPQSED